MGKVQGALRTMMKVLETRQGVRFEQRSLIPPRVRLERRLRRLLTNHFVKSQSIYLFGVNGHRFKRVVLRDSYLAANTARDMSEFHAENIFPALIAVEENEIWLEYVDGHKIETINEEIVTQLAGFYAVVYGKNPQRATSAASSFNSQLHTNLRVLSEIGVLNEEVYRQLDRVADAITPQHVWIGYDYTDPSPHNFVIAEDGQLRAVDVESIRRDQLLGSGVAKACTVWLESYRAQFLIELKRQATPDFTSYMPFIDLYFVSEWVRRSVWHGKTHIVDLGLFDQFRDMD